MKLKRNNTWTLPPSNRRSSQTAFSKQSQWCIDILDENARGPEHLVLLMTELATRFPVCKVLFHRFDDDCTLCRQERANEVNPLPAELPIVKALKWASSLDEVSSASFDVVPRDHPRFEIASLFIPTALSAIYCRVVPLSNAAISVATTNEELKDHLARVWPAAEVEKVAMNPRRPAKKHRQVIISA